MSVWAGANNIPSTAGAAWVQVLLYNATTLVQTVRRNLLVAGYDFSRQLRSFAASRNYTKIVIKLIYSKAVGAVWFDGLSLPRSP